MSISAPKCHLCCFTRGIVDFDLVFVSIGGQRVKCENSIKYLGIILDTTLNWKQHIEYITGRALRAINVVKSLACVTWGASLESLLLVLKGLVMAILEWGSQFILGASQTNLAFLDRIQYNVFRFVLGCMSTTPIYFFLTESGEVPLYLRRLYLTERFVARNASWTDSPLRSKLKLLEQRMDRRTKPLKYISKSGIFRVYCALGPYSKFLYVTRRSSSFDSI